MTKPTEVLLVTAREGRRQLLSNLASLEVDVFVARDCRQARSVLAEHPWVAVVLSDLTHSDGNWCDLLKHLVNRGLEATLVVMSSVVDERLCSEVVWRGAYDLLVEPCQPLEVQQVVEGAIRASRQQRSAPAATSRHCEFIEA